MECDTTLRCVNHSLNLALKLGVKQTHANFSFSYAVKNSKAIV